MSKTWVRVLSRARASRKMAATNPVGLDTVERTESGPPSAGMLPLMKANGGSIVSLDFDATVAWPIYDWMGVAKAALESVNRYLARDLGPKGIRSNLVSAGPIKTMAAKSIPGFETIVNVWNTRAPIGWNFDDTEPSARACVALMSDWFPATTGEIVHVDGGFHAMGA